jgi:hypothetical protein
LTYHILQSAEKSCVASVCFPLLPNSLQYATILKAITKYTSLHHTIFGTYDYGMPPEPSDFSRIDMTAYEFLRAHKLLALLGILRYSQQVQGYGKLETIPAFYMLWWTHPDLLQALVGKKSETSGGAVS